MKRSEKRRWILDTWPLKFLFGYGWCTPGTHKDRKMVCLPQEDFDLELGASRRGDCRLPEEICLHDNKGNGITYHSCEYSIRRILAARAWSLARDWVYK